MLDEGGYLDLYSEEDSETPAEVERAERGEGPSCPECSTPAEDELVLALAVGPDVTISWTIIGDAHTVTVDGETFGVDPRQRSHVLKDGRIVRLTWCDSPPLSLVHVAVEPASVAPTTLNVESASVPAGLTPEQSARYQDATSRVLIALMAETSARLAAETAAYWVGRRDGDPATRPVPSTMGTLDAVHHALVCALASYISDGNREFSWLDNYPSNSSVHVNACRVAAIELARRLAQVEP